MEQPIESRLKGRAAPQMRREFTGEIVARALKTPQRRPLALGEWLTRLFGEFMLPQPAYALAGMLFMGVWLGYMNPSADAATPAQQSLSEILEDDGAVL